MERAYHAGTGYSFTLQYFGQALGYEVMSIDGVTGQSGTDLFLFWEFSVNGSIATKGIDQTVLNDGDKIGWNFTSYDITKHG